MDIAYVSTTDMGKPSCPLQDVGVVHEGYEESLMADIVHWIQRMTLGPVRQMRGGGLVHRRKEAFQLNGQSQVAADAEATGHEQRGAVKLPAQNIQTVFSRHGEDDVRVRMDSFLDRTGSSLDHQMVLTPLWTAQIKLIDGHKSFRRLGVELPRQPLEEIFH